jgi:hypothetical protein
VGEKTAENRDGKKYLMVKATTSTLNDEKEENHGSGEMIRLDQHGSHLKTTIPTTSCFPPQ